MEEIGEYDCPMPETFQEKIGITVVLAWLFYLGFVTRILFGPLMPAVEKDLGISHAEAGLLFLMLSVGYMIAPAVSGLISRKIEHRGALKLSAWLVGLALLPFTFVESIWTMGGLLMIVGFAGSLHLPSAIATITAEIQKSDWGKGLSVHQCAPPLSFISAPLLAAALLHWLNWRQVLLCWAILALLSALLYTLYGRGGEFPGRPVSPTNVKRIGALPSFWIMVALFAVAMGGNAGIFAMLPLFFVAEKGFELGWANTLIGLSQFSGLAVVFFAGLLTDRIGQKRVMALSLSGSALLTITIALADGWLLITALFLQPAVLTAFFPAAFGALARIAQPSMRSVTSALGPPLAFLFGGGLIPLLIGSLAESISFAAGVLVAGSVMLLALPLLYYLRVGQFDAEAGC